MAKYKLTPEQRKLLEDLQAEQMKEKSIVAFVKKFLPFGRAKWDTIMNALDDSAASSYFDMVADREKQFAELEQILDRILNRRAAAMRLDDSAMARLSKFIAVNQAVTECLEEKGPERLIKYLAPTGGGKTWLGQFLNDEQSSVYVIECREAWRRSYFTFLSDICAAMKVNIDGETRPAVIEDTLIEALKDKPVILYFDEGEFFGRESLNGMKLLLNKTRIVPVIAAISEAHDKWNRYCRMEADQISRRTYSVVQLTQVDPRDCRLFFKTNQFADFNAEINFIAAEASKFGHYSLIRRVARKLSDLTHVDRDEVEKAIKSARVAMRREPDQSAK